MDWKGAWIWSLCFIVICPSIHGKELSKKELQVHKDESDKEIPEQSESKVVFVAKDKSEIEAFREDSSNVSNVDFASKEGTPVSQIETPVTVKKFKRLLKTVRKKPQKLQNTTSGEFKKHSSKKPAAAASDSSDPSVSEESERIEEFSNRPDNIRESDSSDDDDSDSSSIEPRFAQAQFVPSEDFRKKLAARKDSSRPAFSIQSVSSEEISRSDSSEERFGDRKRKPLINFNNQRDSKQSHQNNLFPRREAQKVTIVKEKTIHSTSTAEEQERVNIEKNPLHNQPTNDGFLQQEPRTFHSTQNLGNSVPQSINTQEEKIILIEGTHIPGRDYGPVDDTFGFYADSYKDEKGSSTPDNRRKVKVVKVVKNKPDSRIPNENPLNHGNGQSRQYFLTEQQNAPSNKGLNPQPLNNQFEAKGQGTTFQNAPQLHHNNQFEGKRQATTFQNGPQLHQNNQFEAKGQAATFQNIPQLHQNNQFEAKGQGPTFQNVPQLHQNNQFDTKGQAATFQNIPQLHQNNQFEGKRQATPFQNGPQLHQNNQFETKGQAATFQNIPQLHQNNQFKTKEQTPTFQNNPQLHQNNQFDAKRQRTPFQNVPQLHQNNQNQFIPSRANGNAKQTPHIPVQQNFNFENLAPKNNFQADGNSGNNLPSHTDDGQHVVLNMTPDPNELYIDENTGQLIKFVLVEDTNQHPNSNSAGRTFNNGKASQNIFSQPHQAPQVNVGEQLNQRVTNHLQKLNAERVSGTQRLNHHSSANSYGNQPNQQPEGGSYNQVSGDKAGYGPSAHSNDGREQTHYIPQDQNSGNQYHQQGGISDSKDDSEEYVIVCDQDAQDYSAEYQSGNLGVAQQGQNVGGTSYQQPNFPSQNQFQNSGHGNTGMNYDKGQSLNQGGYLSNSGNQQTFGSEYSNAKGGSLQINTGNQGQYKGTPLAGNKGGTNFAMPQNNLGAQGHYKGSQFSNDKGVTNFATPQTNIGAQGHYKGTEFSNDKGGNTYSGPQVNNGAQGHYKGSEFSNDKGVTNFATPQTNIGAQGHYKGTGFSNDKGGNTYDIPQGNPGAQGHFKGTEFSNNNGNTNYGVPQVNMAIQGQYQISEFSNNKGGNNYATPQVNAVPQGHFKGSDFSNNKGGSNYANPQVNIGSQGNYKGSELSNNKGGNNYAPPQISTGGQGQFKGTDFSNNKGGNNYAIPQQNIAAQGNYKGSELSNNKGDTNYAIPQMNTGVQGNYQSSQFSNNKGGQSYSVPQINTGNQGNYKGSDFSNNKGGMNYAIPQMNIGAQGQYKGSEFSNNQGGNNYGILQMNSGGQGQYQGSDFSNSKGGISNVAIPEANVGAQGDYKGTDFSNNKGGNIYVMPQVNTGAQGQYKGSEFSNNKGDNNYQPQVPTVAQGHYKGSDISSNQGGANYAISQANVGAQNNFKGSEFSNNKGNNNYAIPQMNQGAQSSYKGSNSNFASPQTNIGAQGHYKGSNFPNTKQNSKMPVYRENVTPSYPVADDLSLLQGNNKGTNLYQPQNEGNQQKGASGGMYNTGSGFSNQKGYDSGNTGLSNNQGYGGGSNNKGTQYSGISNDKGDDSDDLRAFIISHALSQGSQSSTKTGYNSGQELSSNKGYESGQNSFSGMKGQNKETGYDATSGGLYNNQRQNAGGQIKGSRQGNQKGYNIRSNSGNQKGFNIGSAGYEQSQNVKGKGYEQGRNKGNSLFSGAKSSNTYSNNPQLSNQKGYKGGNKMITSTQNYNAGEQLLDSLKGEGEELALLLQNGYNAQSDLFRSNNVHELFSGALGSNSGSKGSGYSSQKDYNSQNNKGLTDNKGYNVGTGLFSSAVTPKSLNTGSGYSNNKGSGYSSGKGLNIGNNALPGKQGYQTTSISESYSGSFIPKGVNKGSNRNSYGSGNNAFQGNKGYKGGSDLSSNKGYQSGANRFVGTDGDIFKGRPIQLSQNGGYGKETGQNNFKRTNFNQNSGNSGYGRQGAAGYGGGNSLSGQKYNGGNDQLGVAYSSSEETSVQGYSDQQGPVQLILVEEDIPDQKNGNDQVYYLQNENSQEESYLVLDDSALKNHPDLRVMVDGGKDKTYPIRSLATAGLHMARSVIPQIFAKKEMDAKSKKSKPKSFSGQITIGLEIKKNSDKSDGSKEYYINSRSDLDDKIKLESRNDKEEQLVLESRSDKDLLPLKSRSDNENQSKVESRGDINNQKKIESRSDKEDLPKLESGSDKNNQQKKKSRSVKENQ